MAPRRGLNYLLRNALIALCVTAVSLSVSAQTAGLKNNDLNNASKKTVGQIAAGKKGASQMNAGKLNAGLTNWSVAYHDTRIDVAIWYPTTADPEWINAGPFSHHAAPNGPISGTLFPLVLISHGTGGSKLNQHTFATALAQQGFIVAAATHPGDNYQDRTLIADKRYFTERPRQVSHVLNGLLKSDQWSKRIDSNRIGALGHSAGGYTVAALAGATPDADRLYKHCQTNQAEDPSCSYRDPSIGVSRLTDQPLKLPADSGDTGDNKTVADARIRAVVMLAPLAAPIAPGSLAGSAATIRLIGAEHDEVLARPFHFDYLKAQPGITNASLAAGAGHFSFIAPVADQWKSMLGPVAIDPPGFDRTTFLNKLSTDVAAWFVAELK